MNEVFVYVSSVRTLFYLHISLLYVFFLQEVVVACEEECVSKTTKEHAFYLSYLESSSFR